MTPDPSAAIPAIQPGRETREAVSGRAVDVIGPERSVVSTPTPRPWRFRLTRDGYALVDYLGQNLLYAIDAAEANARLAAAAPDLLDALKLLSEDYLALCGDGLTESHQPEVLAIARAAIAKAEGH